jgi:secreted trypsin-like serine protease
MDPRPARATRSGGAVAVAVALVFGASAFAVPGAVARSAGPDPAPYVVNGSPTTIAQWPFLVGLLRAAVSDPFDAQFCGGAAVAERVVLTAAHCVDDLTAAEVDVLYGATTLEPGEGTRIGVDSMLVHAGWDPSTNDNDLALVHTDTAMAVAPIAVATPGLEGLWAPGAIALSAGWGCTSVTVIDDCAPGGFPLQLHHGSLRVRTDADCRAALTIGDIQLYDPASMRCAGETSASGQATDTCQGDSGGPLVVRPAHLPPVLVGVVSWGLGCGRFPGVYTRLENFRTWMRSHGVPMPDRRFRGTATSQIAGTYAKPFACDINADGYDDVVYYQPGAGYDTLRLGTADGRFRNGPPIVVNGSYIPVTGDFNGDRACDVLWYGPGSRLDALWRGSMFGFLRASGPAVHGTYSPVSGDFNGDGRDDILWYGDMSGFSVLWYGTPTGFANGPPVAPPPGARITVGDFSGNGRDDLYLDFPEPTPDRTWTGQRPGFSTVSPPTQVPGAGPLIAGDFDGDGFTDLLRNSSGPIDAVWFGQTLGRLGGAEQVWQSGNYTGFGGRFNADGPGDVLWYRRGSMPEQLWLGLAG